MKTKTETAADSVPQRAHGSLAHRVLTARMAVTQTGLLQGLVRLCG